MFIKATDQYTGHYGIYNVETLAYDLTVVGMEQNEIDNNRAIQKAFENQDWSAVAELSAKMGIDFEPVDDNA
jgi:hypothetical protein